jgi:hypothetical protein
VDHRLLVAALHIGQQVLVLLQRLAEAGDVPVTEDAEAAGEEAPPLPVALDLLRGEKAHERLADREAYAHRATPGVGATASERQH